MIVKTRTFVAEVIGELKKVSWTTRSELFSAAWIVIFSAFCLGIFIGTTDFVLSRLLGLLIR